jgi:hypothetical protein
MEAIEIYWMLRKSLITYSSVQKSGDLARIKIDFFFPSQKPPQTTFSRIDRHPRVIELEHEHGTPINAF